MNKDTESINLKDIADDLIILNKYTLDKLFASENPSDVTALYMFYYKTAKWQKTNSIKANDEYIKMCLKWGTKKIKATKDILKNLGLIQIIQRRKDNKISGWFVEISYIVSESKHNIKIDSNTTQKEQVPSETTSNEDTNALKQQIKMLKDNIKMLENNNVDNEISDVVIEKTQSILDAEKIADLLYSNIIKEQPDFKGKKESWVNDIEKAIRIDNRD